MSEITNTYTKGNQEITVVLRMPNEGRTVQDILADYLWDCAHELEIAQGQEIDYTADDSTTAVPRREGVLL